MDVSICRCCKPPVFCFYVLRAARFTADGRDIQHGMEERELPQMEETCILVRAQQVRKKTLLSSSKLKTNLASDRPIFQTITQRHACLQQNLSRCESFAAPRPARQLVERGRPHILSENRSFGTMLNSATLSSVIRGKVLPQFACRSVAARVLVGPTSPPRSLP